MYGVRIVNKASLVPVRNSFPPKGGITALRLARSNCRATLAVAVNFSIQKHGETNRGHSRSITDRWNPLDAVSKS